MFDINHYRNLILKIDNATTNQQKGKSLEDLTEYLLCALDGLEKTERDVRMDAEEIDLIFWNAQIEEVMKPWDYTILVECKNWSTPSGAPVLDSFISKVRRRSLKTAMFIAANGITGNFSRGDSYGRGGAVEIVRSALMDGIRVIVITLDELRNINKVDDLRHLIKKKYCGLYVHKLFF